MEYQKLINLLDNTTIDNAIVASLFLSCNSGLNEIKISAL